MTEGDVYYWMNKYVDLQEEFEDYKLEAERNWTRAVKQVDKYKHKYETLSDYYDRNVTTVKK